MKKDAEKLETGYCNIIKNLEKQINEILTNDKYNDENQNKINCD